MPLGYRSESSLIRIGLLASIALAALAAFILISPLGAQQAAKKPRPRPAFHFVQPEPINFDDHVGWTQIFNGKTLTDWDGDTDIWHVEDGAIVGVSTPEHPPS